MNKPVKSWKSGTLEIALWKFEKNDRTNWSFTIRKSYKDKQSGEWKQTNYLSEQDMKSLYFIIDVILAGHVKMQSNAKSNQAVPSETNQTSTKQKEPDINFADDTFEDDIF